MMLHCVKAAKYIQVRLPICLVDKILDIVFYNK